MDDDLYGAVLIQARRRRALLDRPDFGHLLSAVAAARAQPPAPPAPPAPTVAPPASEGLPPLPGAKYQRSTPDQIAAFFGRRPSTIPKRG